MVFIPLVPFFFNNVACPILPRLGLRSDTLQNYYTKTIYACSSVTSDTKRFFKKMVKVPKCLGTKKKYKKLSICVLHNRRTGTVWSWEQIWFCLLFLCVFSLKIWLWSILSIRMVWKIGTVIKRMFMGWRECFTRWNK